MSINNRNYKGGSIRFSRNDNTVRISVFGTTETTGNPKTKTRSIKAPMYTLTLHKPDSADYCRGCLMASYSGDFSYTANIEEADLIRSIVDAITQKLSLNETGYTAYVHALLNGVLHAFEVYEHNGRAIVSFHTEEGEEALQSLVQAIQQRTQQALVDREAKERAAKEEATRRQAERTAAREQAELRRLQSKYPQVADKVFKP